MGLFKKKLDTSESTTPSNTKPDTDPVAASVTPSHTHLDKETMAETGLEDKASSQRSPTPKLDSSSDSSNVEIQDEKAQLEIQAVGTTSSDEENLVYPKGVKLGLITLALCLSVFLVALDNTIIATAIPKITDRFKSLGDIGWYGSSYLLTTCALQLFFGK